MRTSSTTSTTKTSTPKTSNLDLDENLACEDDYENLGHKKIDSKILDYSNEMKNVNIELKPESFYFINQKIFINKATFFICLFKVKVKIVIFLNSRFMQSSF